MNAGDTFRYLAGRHIWIVVSDPLIDADHVLIANVTSNKSWQDQACVIHQGEHDCAHSIDVVVFYAKSRIVQNSELDALHASGQVLLQAPLSDALLTRVRAGAGTSTRIPTNHRQLLIDQGLLTR